MVRGRTPRRLSFGGSIFPRVTFRTVDVPPFRLVFVGATG
jgi:hypothetical protein